MYVVSPSTSTPRNFGTGMVVTEATRSMLRVSDSCTPVPNLTTTSLPTLTTCRLLPQFSLGCCKQECSTCGRQELLQHVVKLRVAVRPQLVSHLRRSAALLAAFCNGSIALEATESLPSRQVETSLSAHRRNDPPSTLLRSRGTNLRYVAATMTAATTMYATIKPNTASLPHPLHTTPASRANTTLATEPLAEKTPRKPPTGRPASTFAKRASTAVCSTGYATLHRWGGEGERRRMAGGLSGMHFASGGGTASQRDKRWIRRGCGFSGDSPENPHPRRMPQSISDMDWGGAKARGGGAPQRAR
ncbi:unnamed protein product [Chondrus crispus]|uniref:Uncharacterized protein n=1 Tax=Chondrus crispus TaxID=2769 RepID=R7Q6N5_CHOCR|nr:unnamed protein product [Chondrus crispus]CDF34207.1 unnamed protein product [Chondrus crispus]|eukprot:XP_005714026.1 unnamed protein product [Chondrus crispus]